MKLDLNSSEPIFAQIAKELEDAIFIGTFKEGEQIPSTNEIAYLLEVNPHTVLKGVALLTSQDIIYKKRGLGMFVKQGAVENIRQKRELNFFDEFVSPMVREAKSINISKEQLYKLIEKGYEHELD